MEVLRQAGKQASVSSQHGPGEQGGCFGGKSRLVEREEEEGGGEEGGKEEEVDVDVEEEVYVDVDVDVDVDVEKRGMSVPCVEAGRVK